MASTVDKLRRTRDSAAAALVDAFLAVDAALARAPEEAPVAPAHKPRRVGGSAILGGGIVIVATALSALLRTRKGKGAAVAAMAGAAVLAAATVMCFKRPNTVTLEAAARAIDATEVGATAVCDIVKPQRNGAAVCVANAGDCRAVVSLCLGAAAEAVTTDHKPTLRAEKRRILLADSPLGTVDKVTRCGRSCVERGCLEPHAGQPPLYHPLPLAPSGLSPCNTQSVPNSVPVSSLPPPPWLIGGAHQWRAGLFARAR